MFIMSLQPLKSITEFAPSALKSRLGEHGWRCGGGKRDAIDKGIVGGLGCALGIESAFWVRATVAKSI